MTSPTSQDRARDTILRDGSSIRVRPARPDDEPALLAFLNGLVPESRRMRFAGTVSDLAGLARRWAAPEDPASCSLVAESGIAERVVAHASYDRVGRDSAEVAFIVADEWQGRGIATLLLEELAERAHEAGIVSFCAEVLPENGRMFEVFRESGFPTHSRAEPGSVLVEFPTALEGPARERFERREQIAAAAAVHALLYPVSIAVIGASRRRGTMGGELFHNLVNGGFAGPVYPVNPNADVVQSVAAYRSVGDIPGPVDLAVIAIPAEMATDAARECAEKGVKTVVVVSPGFAEMGPEGRDRQKALLATCRDAGMRLVGPNCMGVVNLEPAVMMNATFSPALPIAGCVGFFSQSGSLGVAIVEQANRLELGLSSFISIGNKADLSGNDFLQFWEDDPATSVIALYLESVGNPRKFARIARRVGRTKPIVAVKSGRSAAGARATSSHTGSIIGASDVTVDALFRQAGVVRTDTLGEFFDVASLLANQPLPAGRRVAIVTNGGGPGTLAADACEADGLVVPPLPEDICAALAEFLPPEAALSNPVDTIDGSPESFKRSIGILAGWEGIDAIIALFVPPLFGKAEDVAVAIHEAALELPRQVPVLTVFMAAEAGRAALRDGPVTVPVYDYPEEAARALAHAARYAEWRVAPLGSVPDFENVREDKAAAALAAALARISAEAPVVPSVPDGGRSDWLRPDEVAHLLECYGIPTGSTPLEAVAGGVEMVVGVVHDRLFGPVIACGASGLDVQLLRDVAVRITPLTDRDAREMVRSLATFPLLDGYRGAPPADVAALEETLLRVSAMVEAHPEIVELDCSPVVVLERGVIVVDARIRIELPEPR